MILTCDLFLLLAVLTTSGRKDDQVCGTKEWWSHMLHELCHSTALHDTRHQRGMYPNGLELTMIYL